MTWITKLSHILIHTHAIKPAKYIRSYASV